jgi:ADP-ribose pyrophosphatase YjhB (NUDIX family)
VTDRPAAWPPRMAVCVGAVVLRDNDILFVRQSKGHALEGQWSIPWGVVEPGEAPEAAVLRETREESGILARLDGLLGFQNLRAAGWIGLIFLCHHDGGTPAPDGVETDAAAYFSLAELDAPDEPIEPWCKWIVARVLAGQCQVIAPIGDNPYQPRLAFL